MINPAAVAIGLGLGAGVWLGYLGGKAAAMRFGGTPFVYAFAGIGAAFAFLPALFLSHVFGGMLGGAIGEIIFGSLGVQVGLALGIGLVLAVGLSLGALVGASFGELLRRARSQST